MAATPKRVSNNGELLLYTNTCLELYDLQVLLDALHSRAMRYILGVGKYKYIYIYMYTLFHRTLKYTAVTLMSDLCLLVDQQQLL